MAFTPEELEQRLAKCTDADTVRGLFSKGVVAEVETIAGREAAERCLSAIGRKEFNALASYPVAEFLKLLWAAVAECESRTGSKEEAMRRIGARSVDDFFSSAVGRALLVFVGGHPKRLVNSAPIAYRSCVSYGERSVAWKDERSCTFTFARDFLIGPYHEGVIKAALSRVGARSVRAECRPNGLFEGEYDVSWE